MKIHRFYISDTVLTERLLLTKKDYPNIHNQMVNVLKLQKEEMVTFFNSYSNKNIDASVNIDTEINQSGFDYTYIIKGIGHKEVLLILGEKIENKIDQVLKNKPKISLYIANIKKDKLEWCAEKVTELGVSDIYLINSERSQLLNTKINSTESSRDRLNKIVTEALEQCGRGDTLNIHQTQDLEKILENLKKGINNQVNYACIIKKDISVSEDLQEKMFHTSNKAVAKSDVNIFIGPEGGWTEMEESLFLENKFDILNLGPTILRAETAAICAISKFV